MKRALLATLALALAACPKNTAPAVSPHGIRLLAATPERETTRIAEVMPSLEADTDQERTPHVVATGETPLLDADGAEFLLAGDEGGTLGFSVDNFLLLETLSEDGKRLGRAAVGFVSGLGEGKERIDLLSRGSFKFEPLEVNLASLVPEHGRFRLKATALDIGGVGAVSDVFVIVRPRASGTRDDLRNE